MMRIVLTCWLYVTCFAWAGVAAAQTDEQAVKAAIVYNLARFSDWQEAEQRHSGEHFKICTDSKNVEAAFVQLGGKSLLSKPLRIVRFEKNRTKDVDCYIAFYSKIRPSGKELSIMAEKGVMTVGADSDFLKRGGAIAVFRQGKTLKFSINKMNMEKAGITPSSKILKLSRTAP